jgi:hypothetical protein
MARRVSAFDKALKEAQGQGETGTPQNRETVEPPTQQNRPTVETGTPQNRETVEPPTQQNRPTVEPSTPQNRETAKLEKITFYLTGEQVRKLDQLEIEYRMHTGHRINRNDLIRHLVEQCSIASFDTM